MHNYAPIMKDDYKNHIGKTKKEISKELGDDLNYYESNTWTYVLEKRWYGLKSVLIIFFDNNIVCAIKIIKTFNTKVR